MKAHYIVRKKIDTLEYIDLLFHASAGPLARLQLVVGNGGNVLETANYPGADKTLVSATPNLFDVTGKLWMRHTFGFVVLEKSDRAATWTATLYDVDGKAIALCDLKRPNGTCR